MLGRRLREAMLGRRKRNGRLMAQARAWLGRYKIHPVAFLGAGCAVAAVAVFCSFYTIGTTVTYNGEVVGAVNSRHLRKRPGRTSNRSPPRPRVRLIPLRIPPFSIPPG